MLQDVIELVRRHSPKNSDQMGKVRDQLKKTRVLKHLNQYHIVVSSMIISFCRSQLGLNEFRNGLLLNQIESGS